MRDPAKLRLMTEAEELAVAVYAATSSFPAAEIQFQITIARRLDFGDAAQLDDLQNRANRVQRMLIRLIVVLRAKGD